MSPPPVIAPSSALTQPLRHAARTLCAALVFAAAPTFASAASGCLATASYIPPPPRALAMAALARQEHIAFGSQTMDAEGRLTESGYSEAEDTRYPIDALPAWQRVLRYWRAVDPSSERLPSLVRFGAPQAADRTRLTDALNQASAARLQGLGVGPGQGLDASDQRALEVALQRVAVIDTPWSAAFISWVAREAGLGADEFVFSEAHVDYAGAAWQAGIDEAAGRPTPQALRACDLMRTPPRPGDLVCHARGARGAALDGFGKIGEWLAARPTGGAPLPMHCDVVVGVDGAGFDAVGGNVLQSVTLRRLAFAPGTRLLDPSYLPEGCTAGGNACVDRHMSRQPWSLLLQWR